MSAFGELFVFVVYFFLGFTSIAFLVASFFVKRSFKILALTGSIIFCVLFFVFKSSQERNYRDNQLRQVGVYMLKDFHGCMDCQVELKEDMTYVISNGVSILESSNWHYEMGGDYFITWLDNDRKQLGSGDYEYTKFVPKVPFEE